LVASQDHHAVVATVDFAESDGDVFAERGRDILAHKIGTDG
jgi:hypothetical protein